MVETDVIWIIYIYIYMLIGTYLGYVDILYFSSVSDIFLLLLTDTTISVYLLAYD